MIYFIIYSIITVIIMICFIFSMGYSHSRGYYDHPSIDDMLIMSTLWPFWLFVVAPLLLAYKIIFAVGAYFGSKNKE